MRRVQAGFGLAEIAIAMAVAGVALLAYQGAREAAHAGAARAALGESLLKAISHATSTGSEGVLCPGNANGCRASIDWSRGWMAFADPDGDRQRSPGETLLHEQLSLGGEVHLRGTAGRTRLVFQPNGGNAGSNVTFTNLRWPWSGQGGEPGHGQRRAAAQWRSNACGGRGPHAIHAAMPMYRACACAGGCNVPMQARW